MQPIIGKGLSGVNAQFRKMIEDSMRKGVDKQDWLCYNIQALDGALKYRGVEQLEARRAHNPEVVGSSPASATKKPPFSKVKRWFFFAKSSDFLTPKLTPLARGVYLGFTTIFRKNEKEKSELF